MSSVGVMASAVTLPSGVDVLLENFTSVADWTGNLASVAGGRTGNMGQLTGTQLGDFAIPAPSQSAVITVGFAHKTSSLSATRLILQLLSDTAGVVHTTLQVNTNGSLVAKLGGTTGSVIGTTAAGLLVVSTWAYIETQVTLDDTAGAVALRVNGTTVLNVTGVDTKFGGTKTVFDAIRLGNAPAVATSNFDDLYITTGVGAPFKGDITVP